MENAKQARTPLATSIRTTDKDSPSTEAEREQMIGIPYAAAVGSLMYAMVATRPDLAYAVGVVSRYMANPGKRHWEAVKHILRYLRGTTDMALTYGPEKSGIPEGYTDSDYAGNPDNRKSTSGYVFMHAGGAISWRSKLQDCTALSTTEAEYIAASEAAKEAIWLQRLTADFTDSGPESASTPTLYCDSQSAIHLVRNPIIHSKTKHIEVRYHHIRELVTEKRLEIRKIDTELNIADSLTKPLPEDRFKLLTGHIGLQRS